MLDDLERKLNGIDPGPSSAGEMKGLTDAIWRLFLVLDDHLGMEERDLVPYLHQAGGQAAIEHLQKEHREQRNVLLAMVNECDACTKPMANICDDARWLIGSLRNDMNREDLEFDKVSPESFLSEDGFVTGQCSG